MVSPELRSASRRRPSAVAVLVSGATVVAAIGVAAASFAPSATVAAEGTPFDGAGVADAVPAEVPGAGAEVVVGGSGHVAKEEGEPAGLTDESGRQAYFSITVESVDVTSSCPGRAATVARPDRRHFLAVEVTAAMSAQIPGLIDGGADVFMPLTADAFRVIGEDGAERGGPSAAAWACFDEPDLAAPFVGPGESTRGLVVLDSDVSTGWVVYQPVPGSGWQWAFGD